MLAVHIITKSTQTPRLQVLCELNSYNSLAECTIVLQAPTCHPCPHLFPAPPLLQHAHEASSPWASFTVFYSEYDTLDQTKNDGSVGQKYRLYGCLLSPSSPNLSCSRLLTWHVHRAVLLHGTPDAQLAVAVVAPALEAPPRLDRARVGFPQGNDGGRDTYKGGTAC
jgi:hypothetical protein